MPNKKYLQKLKVYQTKKLEYQTKCEYEKAQSVLLQIEKLKKRVCLKSKNRLIKKQLREKQKMEIKQKNAGDKFLEEWEVRIEKFEVNCYKKSIANLNKKQAKELQKYRKMLREKYLSTNISLKFSPKLLQTQAIEYALVQQNRFKEAQNIKKLKNKLFYTEIENHKRNMIKKYHVLNNIKKNEQLKCRQTLIEKLNKMRNELNAEFSKQKVLLHKRHQRILNRFLMKQKIYYKYFMKEKQSEFGKVFMHTKYSDKQMCAVKYNKILQNKNIKSRDNNFPLDKDISIEDNRDIIREYRNIERMMNSRKLNCYEFEEKAVAVNIDDKGSIDGMHEYQSNNDNMDLQPKENDFCVVQVKQKEEEEDYYSTDDDNN